ncbi:MAG TPA: alpha/beta hydrolase [Opitutaceae bacterium]|nr:alpha/beta hydrolase [Opitutaceae bacterium]
MNPPAFFRGAAALLVLGSLAGCQSGDKPTAEPALVEGVSSVGMRLNPVVWGTIAHFDIVSIDGEPARSKVRDLVPPGHHTVVVHTVAGFSGRTNNATVTLDLRPNGTYMLRPTSIGGLVYAMVIDNDNGRVVFRPEVSVVAAPATAVPEAPAPAVTAAAAPPPPAPVMLAPPPPPAAAPLELAVWPGIAPGSENATAPETSEERGKNGATDRALRQVSKPTITVYLPDASAATGAALLIAPGGGFEHVTIDKEGHEIARWLAGQGIAGIVLKYRLPKTPGQSYTVDTAMADAMQALRDIRGHAAEWGIDPARLGMIGFSAGGNMAARAAVWPDASQRPAFVGLMYPAIPAGFGEIPPGTPRAFLAQADDDPLGTENAIRFYQWERAKKIPAELHLFSRGGHGFGLGKPGTPTTAWPQLFRNWLASIGAIPAGRSQPGGSALGGDERSSGPRQP